MPLFHMRVPFNNFDRGRKIAAPIYLLAFLAVFLSACGTPKGVSLLYKDNSLAASYLVWSPTGNELAISTNRGIPPVTAIYILDVKTKKIRQVVNQDFGSDLYALSWTRDGEQVIF